MKPKPDRVLTAIFCDDIRNEVGNKMSFMGCYQSEMHVASVPVTFPKLCVFITAVTPKSRPFKSLTLRVMLDDTSELARVEVPAENLFGHASEDEATGRESINTAVMFAPFTVERPATVRVFADTEEGEIVGPSLRVKTPPQRH